jgi:hypothetical protein
MKLALLCEFVANAVYLLMWLDPCYFLKAFITIKFMIFSYRIKDNIPVRHSHAIITLSVVHHPVVYLIFRDFRNSRQENTLISTNMSLPRIRASPGHGGASAVLPLLIRASGAAGVIESFQPS